MVNELEQALERLRKLKSSHVPVLSVYLNLHPERAEWQSIQPRLRDFLAPVKDLADSGDLDHDSSMAVRAAANEAMGMASTLERFPHPGVAIFLCEGLGLRVRLALPRRVWDLVVTGPTPYVRPLQAVLDAYRRVGVVVLDSRHAEVVLYHMGEILHRVVIEAEEVRKANLAGWYGLEEYRHRRHGEEVRHHLFREVAERLARLRRDAGVDLVLVGGHPDATLELLPFLEPTVREIAETFIVDPHTLTQGDLVKRIAELEEAHERDEETQAVEEVYGLSAEGGLGAIGADRVFQAANRYAIAQLLLHDGTGIEGSVCEACGALSRRADHCMECGAATRPISEAFEALARSVMDAGGSVEHVMATTRLADDLVAARLRFDPW